MTIGNGWPIIEVRRAPGKADGYPYTVTIYLRIPPELATPIDGGCACYYCSVLHPDLTPMWDALAVCDADNDHSWTVHYPEARRAGGRS